MHRPLSAAYPRGEPLARRFRAGVCVTVVALLLCCMHAPVRAANGLPNLGGGADLSLGDERRLGQQVMPNLHGSGLVVEDPLLNQYLHDLWQPVFNAAVARGDLASDMQAQFAWQLWLLNAPSINAFALPGGYFGFHLGLLASAPDDAALASVLAHELSHVTQRHIARIIARQDSQAPWVLAAMLLGVATVGANADVGTALVVGGQAAAIQGQLNFSREMEQEADRQGLMVLSDAGFDPKGFVRLFDELQRANSLNDDGAFPYLRSHPLTSQRVADMQARLFGLPDTTASTAPPGLLNPDASALLRLRAQVLMTDSTEALLALASVTPPAGSVPATTRWQVGYQRAIAAWAAQRHADAWPPLLALLGATDTPEAVQQVLRETAIGWLAEPHALPPEVAVRVRQSVEGWLAAAQGDAQAGRRAALLVLAGLVAAPAASNLLGADAAQLRVDDAVQLLRSWLVRYPQDGLAWQLMSRLETAQNRPLAALRADAEFYITRELLPSARDRLKAARDLIARSKGAVNETDAAIIYARERWVLQAIADASAVRP